MDGFGHVFYYAGTSAIGIPVGHVAWGFQIGTEKNSGRGKNANVHHNLYTYGSVDGQFDRTCKIGEPGSAMLNYFRNQGYHLWKFKQIPQANIEAASKAANAWRYRPYVHFGSNCMNAAYDILKAYGWKDLPSPLLTPVEWVDVIKSQLGRL